MAGVHRSRVNGAFLGQYHGKPVCLLATVLKADGGGSAFQVRASDGALITVRLKEPITHPLSGLIEIIGIGQGKNLVLCDSFIDFPEQSSENFQMDAYNDLVNLIQTNEDPTVNPWRTSV